MKRTREEADHGGNEAGEGEKPKAKRGRKVIDYEAFRKEPHLRPIWTKALSRVASKGNSASIRVEVEKGLETLFRKVLRQLESKKSLLDPLEARQAQSTLRDKELEEEEKRLSAHVELEEEELANLTKTNLQNRNDLRLIANLAVDPVDMDRLLAPAPPVDRPHVEPDEEKEEGLTELRREASAAFAQFLGTAAALGDETGNAEREGKLSRLLAVWRQRAESKAGDTTDHRPAGASTERGPASSRKKLAAAFKG